MRSFISMLVAFMCFTSVSYSQWSVGPKVGFGTILQSEQDIKIIPNSDKLPPNLSYLGGSSVFSVGFTIHNDLGLTFLQFEAQGTKYSQAFGLSDFATPPNVTVLDDTQYFIELPVAAGINIGDFRVGGGPILEIAVDRDTDLEFIESFKDLRSKFSGSFQGLVGFKKGIFNMDVRYVYKFTSIVDDFGIGDDQLRLNKSANRLSVSVGMLFGSNNFQPKEADLIEAADDVIIF